MLSKDEAAFLRKEFWTCFGIYMKKHTPLCPKTKWLNYRTGVKDIYFRCTADKKSITVSIDIQHRSEDLRGYNYEQFEELKTLLHDAMGELTWSPDHISDIGQPTARLSDTLHGYSIYNKDKWSEMFQFFEVRLVAFDEFWSDFKFKFEELAQLR